MTLTKEQRKALYRKWQQANNDMSYLAFRRSVKRYGFAQEGCVIVFWCNMWLGIETDGYTHS